MSLRLHSLREGVQGGCDQNEAASLPLVVCLLGLVACVLGVASLPWEVQLVTGVPLVVSSSVVCAPEVASPPCEVQLVAGVPLVVSSSAALAPGAAPSLPGEGSEFC